VAVVTQTPVLRLATRGSPLALWQARHVAGLLERNGFHARLVVVETMGDRRLDVPLDQLGGQGIFAKEVQAAVVSGRADIAVHSAKDLPASPDLGVPGLTLAAFPERADPRDVLVGCRLDTLPPGSTVATGSARRRAQLANLRPDLTFAGLRGNLATRLDRVGEGTIRAVVAAKAALDRLEWSAPTGTEFEVLEPEIMLPQVGQGALAIECRSADTDTRRAVATIDDPGTRPLITAERAFLAELGGGCTLPVGAYARWSGGRGAAGGSAADGSAIDLCGLLASGDGVVVLRHQLTGDEPDGLGRAVARYLLEDAGGHDLGDWAPTSADPAPPTPAAR
jgi:hydroxymethylbilane synthase